MTAYRTILADPPWQYTQPLQMRDGVKRSSADQYATLSVQAICDFYTPGKATFLGGRAATYAPGMLAGFPVADTALLALWITAPLLLEHVQERVCQAWGFTAKQIVPWVKGRLAIEGRLQDQEGGLGSRPIPKLIIQPGMGALTRGCVEYLILATRGKYTALVQSHSTNGLLLAEDNAVILAPKREHSRKPDQQYDLLEALFPGPYLELFATARRAGWTSWGDALPPDPHEGIGHLDSDVQPEPPVSWS